MQHSKHANTDQSGELKQSSNNGNTKQECKRQTPYQETLTMTRSGQIMRKLKHQRELEDLQPSGYFKAQAGLHARNVLSC